MKSQYLVRGLGSFPHDGCVVVKTSSVVHCSQIQWKVLVEVASEMFGKVEGIVIIKTFKFMGAINVFKNTIMVGVIAHQLKVKCECWKDLPCSI